MSDPGLPARSKAPLDDGASARPFGRQPERAGPLRSSGLTPDFFAALRAANTARLPHFKNAQGGPAHSAPDGSDWSLCAWCNAVLGELGEAANLIKKIERGDLTLEAARADLGNELADVETYLDILCFRLGLEGDALESAPDRAARSDETIAPIRQRCGSLQLSTISAACLGQLGRAADDIASVDLGTFEIAYAINGIEHGLIGAQAMLECLAERAEIDLEAATIAKWNEVSRRVGYTGRLTSKGFMAPETAA